MKLMFIGARLFDEVANYAISKGIDTILSESNPNSLNLELADEYFIVPRGMDQPMELAISKDVDAVVPLIGIDTPLLDVAEMKEKLERDYNLPVVASGFTATEISTDKIKTKDFLLKNNINTPKFTKMSKKQYINFKFPLNFPNVLKQSEGQGGMGIKVALSPADVDEYFKHFNQAIVEDFLMGAEISIEVLRWNSKSLALIPVYKGDTTLKGIHPLERLRIAPADVKNLDNQKLRNLAKRIVNNLGSEGITDIDFIFDRKKQETYTIEMNTRPSGTRYLTYTSTDINPMHQLVNMAISEWNPSKIKKIMKQHHAFEMPIDLNRKSNLKSIDIQDRYHNLESINLTQNNSWIIHGPDNAQRITIRAKTIKEAFEILKNIN